MGGCWKKGLAALGWESQWTQNNPSRVDERRAWCRYLSSDHGEKAAPAEPPCPLCAPVSQPSTRVGDSRVAAPRCWRLAPRPPLALSVVCHWPCNLTHQPSTALLSDAPLARNRWARLEKQAKVPCVVAGAVGLAGCRVKPDQKNPLDPPGRLAPPPCCSRTLVAVARCACRASIAMPYLCVHHLSDQLTSACVRVSADGPARAPPAL